MTVVQSARTHSQGRILPAMYVVAASILLLWVPTPVAAVMLGLVAMAASVENFRILFALADRTTPSLGNLARICVRVIPYFCLLIVGPLLLAKLREVDGRWAMALVIYCTFAADTAALYGGRALGKHKLARRVSPNKTIEGLLCGVAAALAVGTLMVAIGSYEASSSAVIVTVLIFTLVGAVGDLYESYLKRLAGLKNSGRLLGEHGGILDRIDAMIAASVAAYTCHSIGLL